MCRSTNALPAPKRSTGPALCANGDPLSLNEMQPHRCLPAAYLVTGHLTQYKKRHGNCFHRLHCFKLHFKGINVLLYIMISCGNMFDRNRLPFKFQVRLSSQKSLPKSPKLSSTTDVDANSHQLLIRYRNSFQTPPP